jgi:hypothetical protein|tara:strand:+ start:61 stop:336 length:276 start_codon:yes stop_codon:yes gene_type:complete
MVAIPTEVVEGREDSPQRPVARIQVRNTLQPEIPETINVSTHNDYSGVHYLIQNPGYGSHQRNSSNLQESLVTAHPPAGTTRQYRTTHGAE